MEEETLLMINGYSRLRKCGCVTHTQLSWLLWVLGGLSPFREGMIDFVRANYISDLENV